MSGTVLEFFRALFVNGRTALPRPGAKYGVYDLFFGHCFRYIQESLMDFCSLFVFPSPPSHICMYDKQTRPSYMCPLMVVCVDWTCRPVCVQKRCYPPQYWTDYRHMCVPLQLRLLHLLNRTSFFCIVYSKNEYFVFFVLNRPFLYK